MRSQPERARVSLVEQSINSDDAKLAVAALELPVLAGLSETAARMLLGALRRRAAPAELDRLATLEQVAEKVTRTAERLEARYSEAFDHARLDQLEQAAAKSGPQGGRREAAA